MAYTVTITYVGLTPIEDQFVYNIARHYRPIPNYTESVAFQDSVYNRNVPNIQHTPHEPLIRSAQSGMAPGGRAGANGMYPRIAQAMQPPFDATQIPFPVPLTQFRLATVSGEVHPDGHAFAGRSFVTFQVDDYKEAFAYKQLGVDMSDQGFHIAVVEVTP